MLAEAIYKGATRPAMKLGVPLVPLVLLVGAGMLLAIWGGVFLSWSVAVAAIGGIGPVLLWMRVVTASDDQRLRQMFLALRLRLRDRNHELWQCRSYSPNTFGKARDVRHV